MELAEEKKAELNSLFDSRQFKRLKEELCDRNEVDVAELLGEMPPERALVMFRLLPKDFSSEVFASMEIEEQHHIINSI